MKIGMKKEPKTDLVRLMNRSSRMSDAAFVIALSAILIALISFMLSI